MALIVSAHVLFKEKDDGRFTCRVAASGDTLPVHPGQENFASVCSDLDKMFCLAAMQAHCDQRNEFLNICDIDVVGAFLRIQRPAGSTRLFLRFPKNFPHVVLAGMCLEVFGALYGILESNRLFDLELTRVFLLRMLASRMIFHLRVRLLNSRQLILNLSVLQIRTWMIFVLLTIVLIFDNLCFLR